MDDNHSGDEVVWYDDVVGNLETFTRLSKAGHFERANLFFERKLKPYSDEIPVAAQYADSLIDQGAFRAAEEFLANYQPREVATGSGVATETQVLTVFRLMLTIAQLYTKFEPVKAAEVALSAIEQAGTVTIGKGMSQINLQIMILSLRIIDLVRRVPSLSDRVTLVLPLRTRPQQRPELAWEDAIIALLTSQHLWEAQTLLTIHIRNNGVQAVSKPIDILDAVPRKQDAMYMLAYLTILALLSKTLSWDKSVTDTHLERWKESHEDKIDLLSRPMDDITDPVTTSRAYQKLIVFQRTTALAIAKGGSGDQESTTNFTFSADASEALAGLRDLRFEASCHKDYLFAMEIYEASGDVLPDEYLQATGASNEAIRLLYPEIRVLDSLQNTAERRDANVVGNPLAAGTNVNAGSGDQVVPDDDSIEVTQPASLSTIEHSPATAASRVQYPIMSKSDLNAVYAEQFKNHPELYSELDQHNMAPASSISSEPVRVLSLDGGGVRGLAELVMLEQLFQKLNQFRRQAKLPPQEPWEFFDIIGGTSTGGLIAVMLGRLRMSIRACLEQYRILSDQAFSKKNMLKRALEGKVSPLDAHYDTAKLEEAIKSVVNDSSSPQLLQEEDMNSSCKVFVVSHLENLSRLACFRSYYNIEKSNELYKTITIWEACRATSAATTFFDPIVIGGSRYSDGGLQYNNPISIAYAEALEMFPGRQLQIVSLGTGKARPKEYNPGLVTVAKQLADIATATHNQAQEFLRNWDDTKGQYFRFSPDFVGEIGLDEARQLDEIRRLTVDWIDETGTGRNFVACAKAISGANLEEAVDTDHHSTKKSRWFY